MLSLFAVTANIIQCCPCVSWIFLGCFPRGLIIHSEVPTACWGPDMTNSCIAAVASVQLVAPLWVARTFALACLLHHCKVFHKQLFGEHSCLSHRHIVIMAALSVKVKTQESGYPHSSDFLYILSSQYSPIHTGLFLSWVSIGLRFDR